MSRRRGTRPWIVSGSLALLAAWACGGPQELGGMGDVCYRDDDCEPGLVCVAPAGSEDRRCTDDVSGLVSMVPGAPPPMTGSGGTDTAGGAPGSGGTTPASGGTSGSGATTSAGAPGAGGA